MTSSLLPRNTSYYAVSGLQPFVEYKVYVFAYTSVGEGRDPALLVTRTASSCKFFTIFCLCARWLLNLIFAFVQFLC